MSLQVENLEHNMAKLTITVSAEEVEKALQAAYLKQRSKISLPGFRKGKVPRQMIEKMYGPEVFYDEAANHMISEAYGKAYDECELEIASQPTIDIVQLEKGKPFIFTAEVAVKPEVKLGEYKGLKVDKYSTRVTQKEVDEEIEKVREQHARIVEVTDRAVADKDDVTLDFEGFVDGVAFEGGKADSHLLKLGSNMFIPGFEDQLVGYTKGQEGEVNVTFPAEYHAANLAGKPAVFKVKINAVKLLNKPELNEEFAKANGFESVEDLKAKKSEEVAKRGEENAKNENRGKMLRKVTEAATVEVPQSLVIREVEAKLADLEQQLMMQGMDLNGYLKMTGMTMDTIYNQLAPMSENKVKMDLILDKISQVENLEVSEDEVKEKTEEVAKMYGMTPEILKEELDKAKRYESFINSIKTDLLMSKAIELIEANVK